MCESCAGQHLIFLFIDFCAGKFHYSLSDAKSATDLQPSYVKAIFTGKRHLRKRLEIYVVILI